MIVIGFNKWKALAITLGVILLVLLAGSGALYYRLTAKVDPREFGETNPLDAREARRKLKLFDSALQSGPAGYIRLSRAEINSLLDQPLASAEIEPASTSPQVVRCRLDFSPDSVSLCCWVQKEVMGFTTTLVWQRTGTVSRQGDHWVFEPTEMRLGQQVIPQRFWRQVEELLGGAGTGFMERCQWLQRVPSIQVTENDLTRESEMQLFTYLETNFFPRAN